jgi:catechol 2,3-dioxygenase-like lactoylglutathione lyase family enzyme
MRFFLAVLLLGTGVSAQMLPPNEAGVAMGHLHIITSDPDAQKKLWVDVLGGKPVTIGRLEFAMFPGVLVGFRKGESDGGTDGSIVDHLGFLVRDLAATKAKLAVSAKILRELPDTHQFFAGFPGGVVVEFTEESSLVVPIKHHHIHFATPDVDEMRAWYVNLFGAIPGMRGKFKAADLPGVNLSWKPIEKASLPTKGRSLDHIGFEVKGINDLFAKAQAAGAKVDLRPTEMPEFGVTVATFIDPWGTRVELTQRLEHAGSSN